ncbi:MAG TPA: hypothetical protein VM491_10490 [Burkholderiaceae bacterium]|jgi:drug/metabolite transporter (DMT)-like permease|nr:hypothetical protein [Burkholderiaceae bacterium]
MADHRFFALTLLVCAILLSTTGELFLKKGMTSIGGIEFTVAGLFRTFTNWQVLLGFSLFFAGALVWLKVLSIADLSWAYPMLALGYPLVVFSSFLFLGEPVTVQRVLGSALILAGVYVMFHSWDPSQARPAIVDTFDGDTAAAPPVARR